MNYVYLENNLPNIPLLLHTLPDKFLQKMSSSITEPSKWYQILQVTVPFGESKVDVLMSEDPLDRKLRKCVNRVSEELKLRNSGAKVSHSMHGEIDGHQHALDLKYSYRDNIQEKNSETPFHKPSDGNVSVGDEKTRKSRPITNSVTVLSKPEIPPNTSIEDVFQKLTSEVDPIYPTEIDLEEMRRKIASMRQPSGRVSIRKKSQVDSYTVWMVKKNQIIFETLKDYVDTMADERTPVVDQKEDIFKKNQFPISKVRFRRDPLGPVARTVLDEVLSVGDIHGVKGKPFFFMDDDDESFGEMEEEEEEERKSIARFGKKRKTKKKQEFDTKSFAKTKTQAQALVLAKAKAHARAKAKAKAKAQEDEAAGIVGAKKGSDLNWVSRLYKLNPMEVGKLVKDGLDDSKIAWENAAQDDMKTQIHLNPDWNVSETSHESSVESCDFGDDDSIIPEKIPQLTRKKRTNIEEIFELEPETEARRNRHQRPLAIWNDETITSEDAPVNVHRSPKTLAFEADAYKTTSAAINQQQDQPDRSNKKDDNEESPEKYNRTNRDGNYTRNEKEPKDDQHKDFKDHKDLEDDKDPKDYKDQKDTNVDKDNKDPKDTKDNKDTKDLKDAKNYKDPKDRKDIRDQKDTKDLKDTKDQKDNKNRNDTKDLVDNKDDKDPKDDINEKDNASFAGTTHSVEIDSESYNSHLSSNPLAVWGSGVMARTKALQAASSPQGGSDFDFKYTERNNLHDKACLKRYAALLSTSKQDV